MREVTPKQKAPVERDLRERAHSGNASIQASGKFHLLQRHLDGAEGALKHAKQHARQMKRIREEAKLAMKLAKREVKTARQYFTAATTKVKESGSDGLTSPAAANGDWRQIFERAKKAAPLGRKEYEKELQKLQAELCYLQDWVKAKGLRVVVIFEGRDAAGKGGTIRALTERVSPRVFRVVALPAPSDREKTML